MIVQTDDLISYGQDQFLVMIDLSQISDADASNLGLDKQKKSDMLDLCKAIQERITDEFASKGISSIPIRIIADIETTIESLNEI